MSSEKVDSEEPEWKGDVIIPTSGKQDDTSIQVPEMENNTRSTTRLINVSELATNIYRIGRMQLIFGILIFCGMGLYLGLILVGIARSYVYFGERCNGIYESWEFFEYDEGYIIAAIVTGVIVSSSLFLLDENSYIYSHNVMSLYPRCSKIQM